jgi:hypothetical protein
VKKTTRIGVGGPVGSGKTALIESVTPRLTGMGLKVLIITNDIVTTEDAKHVQRTLKGVLIEDRIRGVETGACPHTAVREDPSMLRPGSWIRPAGASPVRVGTGAPGSRPQPVGETRQAERGVESLFGGSKRAGRSIKRILQPRQIHNGGAEPLMSRRRPCPAGPDPGSACRVPPGYGEWHARKVWSGTGEARLPGRRRAKTAGISRW